MIADTTSPLLTTEEIAELFNISKATVLNWAKKGKITCYRVCKNVYRYPKDKILIEVKKYLKKGKNGE